MNLHDLLAFILVLAAAAAIPGPDVAAIVARALSRGTMAMVPVLLGITIGHCAWMLAALVGLVALAKVLGPVFVALKLAGAAYLIYLAYKLWTEPVTSADAAPAARGNGFAAGLLVSFSNPKALVFFSAVVPSVLPIERLSAPQMAAVEVVSAVTILAVLGLWGIAAARARQALESVARRRALNRTSAVIMAGTGVAIAAR